MSVGFDMFRYHGMHCGPEIEHQTTCEDLALSHSSHAETCLEPRLALSEDMLLIAAPSRAISRYQVNQIS
jgi:hypothetical protein